MAILIVSVSFFSLYGPTGGRSCGTHVTSGLLCAVPYFFYEKLPKHVRFFDVRIYLSGDCVNYEMRLRMGVLYRDFPPSAGRVNYFLNKVGDRAVHISIQTFGAERFTISPLRAIFRNFPLVRRPKPIANPRNGEDSEYFRRCRVGPCNFAGDKQSKSPKGRHGVHLARFAYSDRLAIPKVVYPPRGPNRAT